MIRLRYQNAGASAVTKTVRELSVFMLPDVARVTAVTLRGRRLDHKLHARRTWDVSLITEAGEDDILWLLDWWAGDRRWLQWPYDANDALNWVEISTDDGRCPVTFADGILAFPEARLTLYEKEPV